MNSHPTRRRILQYGAALAALGAPGLARAQSPVRLSYWHHFASQTEQKGLRRLTEMFRAKYPSITMAIETIPNAEYLTKITASVVANSRPDTCMIAAERFADMYAMNALVDISPEVAKWDRKGDFKPIAWKGAERDGKAFGVPAYSFVNWMYYRKDFFEEAGLSGPPDTMPEFLEACIKITNPAKNRYGFGMRGGGGGHQYLMDMLIAYGCPIVVDGKPAIDRAKAIEAVRFFSDLYTKYKVVPPARPNDSFRQIMEGFKTGQTAMIWHHTGSLTELSAALKPTQLGTALRPKGPVCGRPGSTTFTTASPTTETEKRPGTGSASGPSPIPRSRSSRRQATSQPRSKSRRIRASLAIRSTSPPSRRSHSGRTPSTPPASRPGGRTRCSPSSRRSSSAAPRSRTRSTR